MVSAVVLTVHARTTENQKSKSPMGAALGEVFHEPSAGIGDLGVTEWYTNDHNRYMKTKYLQKLHIGVIILCRKGGIVWKNLVLLF